MSSKIRKRALKYLGSKWSIAPWIISFMEPHKSYISPTMGALNVLFRKDRVKCEIVSDINHDNTNFFKQLRDNRDELIRLINLTPWSEKQYEDDFNWVNGEEAVFTAERARAFYSVCWMGGSSTSRKFWRVQKNPSGRYGKTHWEMIDHDLKAISDRLQGVAISQADIMEIVSDIFSRTDDALVYLDPPYLKSLRTATRYGSEVDEDVDETWHKELCRDIYKHGESRMALMSGKMSDLYQRELDGWEYHLTDYRENSGSSGVECIWLSPELSRRRALRIGSESKDIQPRLIQF